MNTPPPIQDITLRDYFAAAALQALIGEVADWKYMTNELSKFAYKQADAMIRERKNDSA